MARGGSNTNPSGDNKTTRETDKVVTRASTDPDLNQALLNAIRKSR